MNYKEYYKQPNYESATLEEVPFFNFHTKMQEHAINELIGARTVLDVGCYKGFITNALSDFFNIEGCDINKGNLKIAKKNFPKINFFCHDFEEKKLNKKYDVIILFQVIEHIFDYRAFLENLKHSLKEGGRLLIATPNYASYEHIFNLLCGDTSSFFIGGRDEHIRFFSIVSIKKILAEVGFSVERIFTYSNLPFIPHRYRGMMLVIAREGEG